MFDKSYVGTLPDSSNKNQHQHSVYLSSTDNFAYQTWFIDSGASCHVTNDANNIQHKQKHHGKETSTVGNGEKLNICHIGLVKLPVEEECLLLKETFYVPEIEKILISVSKLVASNKLILNLMLLVVLLRTKRQEKFCCKGSTGKAYIKLNKISNQK